MKSPALTIVKNKGGRPPISGPVVAIEKGIPMPPTVTRLVFPFADMAVGDSFEVACAGDRVSMTGRIRGRFRYWKLKQCPRVDITISMQRTDKGVRCWRTA